MADLVSRPLPVAIAYVPKHPAPLFDVNVTKILYHVYLVSVWRRIQRKRVKILFRQLALEISADILHFVPLAEARGKTHFVVKDQSQHDEIIK